MAGTSPRSQSKNNDWNKAKLTASQHAQTTNSCVREEIKGQRKRPPVKSTSFDLPVVNSRRQHQPKSFNFRDRKAKKKSKEFRNWNDNDSEEKDICATTLSTSRPGEEKSKTKSSSSPHIHADTQKKK
mmetsp:Transcript_18723/g.33491  ORF Transcript_18723/g.33491 Transcript_18723/m.33491 type:complete len:128 (-) Transcript_18723:2467-2850(-)